MGAAGSVDTRLTAAVKEAWTVAAANAVEAGSPADDPIGHLIPQLQDAIASALKDLVKELGVSGKHLEQKITLPDLLLHVSQHLHTQYETQVGRPRGPKNWSRSSINPVKGSLALSNGRRNSTERRDNHLDSVSFQGGERLVMAATGTLVDATIVHQIEDKRFAVRLGAKKDVHEMELNAAGCCKNRFATAAAYTQAVKDYCNREKEKNTTVEDGITGNKLTIEDQLLFITTENQSGASAGTFLDRSGGALVDESTFEFRLAGAHDGVTGKRLTNNGPFIIINNHPENQAKHYRYVSRLSTDGEPLTVKLEGPPTVRRSGLTEPWGESLRGCLPACWRL